MPQLLTLKGGVTLASYGQSGGPRYIAVRATTDLAGLDWQPPVPITHDWQPLNGGVEVRLNQRDWESAYVIAFGARDQLVSRIERIEGNVLTLQDATNRTVQDAVVRHNDTFALQAAVDRALTENRHVRVPAGYHRLAHSIRVTNAAAIAIEGTSSVDTLLDLSDGEGARFTLSGGTEVTIRNFRMSAHLLIRFLEDHAPLYTTLAATTHCLPSIRVHRSTRRKSLGPFSRCGVLH